MDQLATSSSKEKRILEALRENPQLLDCVYELAEISRNKIDDLEFADDAEEATVDAIQKTGKAVLEGWFEKKRDQVTEVWRSKRECREHEKKNFSGKHH